MPSLISQANKNIKYYIWVRIFAKRVFLPITAIYFIDTANLSIRDIGILSAYFSLIQFIAEVPTGYYADRIGRVKSLRIGTILAALATSIYVIFHTKSAIYLGVGLEALGYSFMGGAGEALIHDSLHAKKQTSLYTKIMSHNMAVSLVANAVLVALATYTYRLDPRLPFILGTLCYLILMASTTQLSDIYPPQKKKLQFQLPSFPFLISHKSMLAFGLTFGVISSLYTSPNDMFNIALREYGISAEKLGIIYGIGSIVGSLFGPINSYLRSLSARYYVLIDSTVLLTLFASATTKNPYLLALVMVLAISFWRYRRIIYQDYLLQIYPNAYKATLVSTLNNLEQVNSIWMPIVITAAIHQFGLSTGFVLISLFTLLIVPIFYISTIRFIVKRLKK
ncbi:MAG: MFS transporter [Candidatus Moraniibacteriota bacterium]|nr:MAG: MFS transporter [Candidatus Moranbacteria bacterium]